MKDRKAYKYQGISYAYLSPQYDLLGGNAGHLSFHAYSGGFI